MKRFEPFSFSLLFLTFLLFAGRSERVFANAQENLKAAQELLDEHWYKEREALKLLKEAYAENPSDHKVQFLYAKVLYLLRHYDQAAKLLKEVWTKYPEDYQAHAYYAYCIGRMAQKEKGAKQLSMQTEAKKHLEKSLRLNKDFAEGWLAYAIGMHHLGKMGNFAWAYKDSEKYFQKVFALTPRDPYALVEYGYLKLTLGEKDEAEKYFKRAMMLARRDERDGMMNSDIPRTIALYLEDSGQFGEGLEYAKIALQWNPKDIHTFSFQSNKKLIARLENEKISGKRELKDIADEL